MQVIYLSRYRSILTFAALVFSICSYALAIIGTGTNGGDIAIYLTAGHCVQQHQDPYATGIGFMRYLYPPVTLPFAELLASISPKFLPVIYDSLSILAYALIVWEGSLLLSYADWLVFTIVCPYAFSAIYSLLQGNVDLFLCCALLGAVYAFVSNKTPACIALVCACSLIKFPYIALLLVPALNSTKARRACAIGFVSVLAVYLLQMTVYHRLFHGFIGNVSAVSVKAYTTECNVLGWLNNSLLERFGWNTPLTVDICYILYSLVVIVVGLRALSKLKDNALEFSMLSLLLYAVLIPRLECDQYILFVIPTVYGLQRLNMPVTFRIFGLVFLVLTPFAGAPFYTLWYVLSFWIYSLLTARSDYPGHRLSTTGTSTDAAQCL